MIALLGASLSLSVTGMDEQPDEMEEAFRAPRIVIDVATEVEESDLVARDQLQKDTLTHHRLAWKELR